MKNSYFLAALFVLVSLSVLSAQNDGFVNVSGIIVDEDSNETLPSASAVLLQAQDSVIAAFSISNKDGKIVLRRVKQGAYVLQVSYLGYHTFSQSLDITNTTSDLDIGLIQMKKDVATLQETVVTGERIPISIRKDTIVYNADAFKTQPNDKVEDLLRKMPGIEVEQDGTIIAQGEEVEKILVDGKEFFGGDPKIATKNLPAKAVDEVEIFDKKSDQAEFTGIDDGERIKAMNLELKEEYKEGIFGNLTAGYGSDDRYTGKVAVNKFDKNQQISVLGQLNNVNEQGFSISEYVGFMGGISNLMRGGGGRRSLSGGQVPINDGMSDGFVKTGAGGINYNRDFSKKTRLNVSYFFNSINNELDQLTNRENFYGDASYFSVTSELQESTNANHRIAMTLRHEIDSNQNIILRSDFSINNTDVLNQSLSQTSTRTEGQSISDIDNDIDNERNDLNASLIYRRKFKKKGRSLVADLSFGLQSGDQSAYLRSLNVLNSGTPQSKTDTIFQNQFELDDQNDYRIKLTLTEPLGNRKYLGLSYSRRNFSNDSDKEVYDVYNETQLLNNNLSNIYDQSYTYDNAELAFRWIKGASNINMALGTQWSKLDGEIISSDTFIYKDYFNLLPSLSWDLDFDRSKRFSASYRTNVNEPSFSQLQPIVDNSDPLNLYVGNPDLKPEYRHTFRLRYHSFSQFNMSSLFANISASYTEDNIVNSTTIDDQLRQVRRPVNVDDEFRISTYLGGGYPLRFIKHRMNVRASYTYSNSQVVINDVTNETNRFSPSINVSFDNINKDRFDFNFGGRFSRSLTKYTSEENQDQDFNNQTYYTSLTWNFVEGWALNSSFDYQIYRSGTGTDDGEIPIWKASISKYLMNDRMTLKLSVFDILDENVGYSQNIDLNYVEDVRVNSLGRYFLFSINYDLNKMGKSELGRGVRIMRGPRH
jgi:hypothetical protein